MCQLVANKYVKNYKLIFAYLLLLINDFEAKIDFQYKLCGDNNCNAPIGFGKTTVKYSKSDDHLLSFPPHVSVIIFGKTENDKLLYVEINKIRGFVPKNLILEERMINKNPQIKVKINQSIDENVSNNSDINSDSNVQNTSDQNTDNISDSKTETGINQPLDDESTKKEEPLQSSHSESESETVSVLKPKDGFTMIEGTLLPDDDYVSVILPTIMSDASTTATKTATISANLNFSVDSDIINTEHIKSSLTEETGEQTKVENQIKDGIDEKYKSHSVSEDLQNSIKPSLATAVVEPTVSESETVSDSNNAETKSEQIEVFAGQHETVSNEDISLSDSNIVKSDQLVNQTIADNPIANEAPVVNDTPLPESQINVQNNETLVNDNPITNETPSVNNTPLVEPQINVQNNEVNSEKVEEKSVETENVIQENELPLHIENAESLLENVHKETLPQQSAIDLPANIDNNEVLVNSVIDSEIVANNSAENDSLLVKEVNLETIAGDEPSVDNTNANELPENIVNNEILDHSIIDSKISDNNSVENDASVVNVVKPESITENEPSVDDSHSNDLHSDIQNEILDSNKTDNNELKQQNISDNTDVGGSESIPESVNLSDTVSQDNKHDVNIDSIDSDLNNFNTDDSKIFRDKTIEDSIKLPNDSNLESVLRNLSLDNITHTDDMPVIIDNNENFDSIAVKIESFERQTEDNYDSVGDILPDYIKSILNELNISAPLVVILLTIAFPWSMCKFILAILFSKKKETDLRDNCCKAQRQAYYFEAEKVKLHEELEKERAKAQLAEDSLQKLEHTLFPMEMEIKKLKTERDHLQQRVASLESELESATEAGFELNTLLNDFLTSQKENVNLNSSFDALQQQITKQEASVALYETTAKQKEKENYELKERCEKLTIEMDRLKGILKDTENNFEIIQLNNEDLKASKSDLLAKFNELQENYSNVSHRLTEYTSKHDLLLVEIKQFNDKVDHLTNEIENRDKEIASLKEIIDKIYSQRNGDANFAEEDGIIDSLNDLYNAVKIQSQLRNAESERNDLSAKYDDLMHNYQQLNNRILELDEYNKKLIDDKENAVQERFKAQMELEVLSKYYKEKELELGKQIGVQHVQRMQKEDDASSLAAQLAAIEEENASYKTQFLSMKKEVAESDRRFKSQISQLEKQAHDNWILARNAERKLEEAKAEAAVLRQTLTMNVKSPVDGFVGDSSYLDDSASSVSSLHEHFMGAILPPPPPPPPPPPMSMYNSFNGYLPSMPFDENDRSYGAWNSSANSQTPIHTNFMPIQNEMLPSNNGQNYPSNQHPLSYIGSVQQQWDASSNRDTYSPAISQRSNSPHQSFNAYPQSMNISQTHYTNPYSTAVNASDYSYSGSAYDSFSSPVSNSVAHTTSVLSNPIPSHWTKPNGNIPNNVNSREYNETDSRPTSRISDNSHHNSFV